MKNVWECVPPHDTHGWHLFLVAVFWVAVVLVAVVLGGDFPTWQFSGGSCPGGSSPGGCRPDTVYHKYSTTVRDVQEVTENLFEMFRIKGRVKFYWFYQ